MAYSPYGRYLLHKKLLSQLHQFLFYMDFSNCDIQNCDIHQYIPPLAPVPIGIECYKLQGLSLWQVSSTEKKQYPCYIGFCFIWIFQNRDIQNCDKHKNVPPPLAPVLIGVECYKFQGILSLQQVLFTEKNQHPSLISFCFIWSFQNCDKHLFYCIFSISFYINLK